MTNELVSGGSRKREIIVEMRLFNRAVVKPGPPTWARPSQIGHLVPESLTSILWVGPEIPVNPVWMIAKSWGKM